ncbi:hypothetical protein CEUSTIGMA_g11530.t1 [Chlamydomonas eustigma]|uniref:SH3 domain-containing protein n=1 Tax=Chlamydomonas eustigma TaxID=1157962 RepID=A0A250XM10_9CHLO|nr:hypothetical protein CEUSTIGMA_g11530.t1 [Chlamydomonas eustigma]|eukprot:GAX84107.1 hypothetical protein CEUSTIGMA_g11530.t1 [Chlamydomonas eustigma]
MSVNMYKKTHEVIPTLNAYIRSTLLKSETGSYADGLEALASFKLRADDPRAPKDLDGERLLSRLVQHGHITIASVQPILEALKAAGMRKDDRSIGRFVYYLVQLLLGDGSAGTPLPVPVSKSTSILPKAVDRFGPEVLSASWADLGVDKSPFMNKQGALRALAALTHASLTSRPEDPTYVGGLFVTLQSLLDSLDSIRASWRSSLVGFIAQQAGGGIGGGGGGVAGTAGQKKTNALAEFRARMEVWGLMRIAFSAARVALSRSGINKIAMRSFAGVCSTDSLCARHALALASLVARDGQAARTYIDEVGSALARNVDMARRTGQLFSGGASAASAAPGSAPPEITRELTEGSLNLKDLYSRVYLARGCASVIQSGNIAGDLNGSGAVFWEAMQFLILADSSELVALEATKSIFGAPFPKAETSIRRRLASGPFEGDVDPSQSRTYGASWHMMMSVADTKSAVAESYLQVTESPATLQAHTSGADPNPEAGSGSSNSFFSCLVARLLRALKSKRGSLVCSACRAVGVMMESRAWCSSMSGGQMVESEAVTKNVVRLQTALLALVASDASWAGSCEKCAALEALLWMQQAGPVVAPLITPGGLLKCMVHGGHTTLTVVRVLFADPWPEGLISSFLSTVMRCTRCTGGGVMTMDMAVDLAMAAAAAVPSRVSKDQLIAFLDAAPGPSAVKACMSMLSAPLPPITQPNSNAPVEVKVLASQEEAAFEVFRGTAAWWLGEHVNQLCGSSAWKAVGKGPIELPAWLAPPSDPSERMALAAATHCPMLVAVISHLQRALLAGSWELRCTSAQALAKVAVRSREPYRIQCYSALAATQKLPFTVTACTDMSDVMGLAAVVRPALEVLDAMYSGEMVVSQNAELFGRTAASWPKGAVSSLRRRHEYLIFQVLQRIGFVPKDGFYPLGPFSKRLLKPDEPLDEEEEEEEKLLKAAHVPMGLPKNILEAAVAAAEAAVAAEQQEETPPEPEQTIEGGVYDEQYYDEQYGYDQQYEQYAYDQSYYDQNGQYEDGQYYDNQYYAGGQTADPLASWQEGTYDSSFAPRVAVNIPGEGEESTYTSYAPTPHDYNDDEDFRWGTAQYGFNAEGSDEVSVAVGQRVKVLMDMGDWYHVLNSMGARGLVPSSYVALDQQSLGLGPGENSSISSEYQAYGGNAYGSAYAMEQDYYTTGGSAGAINNQNVQQTAGAGGYQSRSFQRSDTSNSESTFMQSAGVIAPTTSTSYNPAGSTSTGSAKYKGVDQTYNAAESGYDEAYSNTAGGYDASNNPDGYPAIVMFDFTAEQENELTVKVGDDVVVGAEIDGWYQTTRLRDGVSGLIPASYVQFLQK